MEIGVDTLLSKQREIPPTRPPELRVKTYQSLFKLWLNMMAERAQRT